MARIDTFDASRLLSLEECERLLTRIRGFSKGGGDTVVEIAGWWNGELRWTRNRVSLASDRRSVMLSVRRILPGGRIGEATGNQLDSVSLEAMVRLAERIASLWKPQLEDMPMPEPPHQWSVTTVWSDATFNTTAETRGNLAHLLAEKAQDHGMFSAGYLEMRAGEIFGRNNNDDPVFHTCTQAQCSMTVRHPKGTGSGWAGLSSYDWTAINGLALADRALQKCLDSIDPVRIEPGRYTVVLEPQAVADLVADLIPWAFDRREPEIYGRGPFFMEYDRTLELLRTKLGMKVIDERITISHDPGDPQLGVFPALNIQPITWIERGVLKTLSYDRGYALTQFNENSGAFIRESFRMSGGETSIEEMIHTTKRGILVTRFSNLRTIERQSYIANGLTRDGLWLIEEGKVSKAIRNLRVTESPLFCLNQVEQLGVPVPVYRPVKNSSFISLTPALVPPVKANDFSFTALADAI